MGILERFSLSGKVAVVTGGDGNYGRQIVRALAEAGADVTIASRNLERLEAAASEYRKQDYDVTAWQLDQGDEASILALRDAVIKKSGKVDILVNNAVTRIMRDYHDDAAVFAKSMQNNATGIFLLTRAFGDAMATRQCGSIINIGSIQGMIAPDASLYFDELGNRLEGLSFDAFVAPDYWMHKGGMINLTRFTAAYYGRWKIRCNCISPGGLSFSSPGDAGYKPSTHPVEFLNRYCAHTFLNRMANDTDLMGIVVFLASDTSQYVTGTNIPVDGGYTAK